MTKQTAEEIRNEWQEQVDSRNIGTLSDAAEFWEAKLATQVALAVTADREKLVVEFNKKFRTFAGETSRGSTELNHNNVRDFLLTLTRTTSEK